MKDLKGKKAVVTGAAMGIGLSTCRRLIREGCSVTMWDINGPALEEGKKELEQLSGEVFAYPCDVTDKARISDLAEQARRDMGNVDILINSAGYVQSGRFCDLSTEVLERQTNVNLTSMYYTINSFLPEMYERNLGHIVNISSAAGMTGIPNLAVYCATKWGVWGLTESLRLEAMLDGKNGVKFSTIHPYFVRHGMFEGGGMKSRWVNLFFSNIKSHDVVAKAIVTKALKKNRHVVKLPKLLHGLIIMRGLLPDFLFAFNLKSLGIGESMEGWTGRPGSEHAAPQNDIKKWSGP